MAEKQNLLKKLGDGILEKLLPLLKPFVIDVIRSYIFNPLQEKNPQVHKEVLVIAYPLIDIHAEDWASKTENQYDDFGVACVKEAIEEEAKEVGITLPNLDND